MPKNRRPRTCVEGELCFWVNNGPILKDLFELRDALQNMSPEIFSHHVNKDKNDFSIWVGEVMQDAELAKKMLRNKSSASMFKTVDSHLKNNYMEA